SQASARSRKLSARRTAPADRRGGARAEAPADAGDLARAAPGRAADGEEEPAAGLAPVDQQPVAARREGDRPERAGGEQPARAQRPARRMDDQHLAAPAAPADER